MYKVRRILYSLFLSGVFLSVLFLFMGWRIQVTHAVPENHFVSVKGSGTECSQIKPCTLATALFQAETKDRIYMTAGTYKGSGSAVTTVDESIALLGGWNGSSTGLPVRDPEKYRTILDGEDERRGVYITGDITPTLDGLIIAHGNATGLIDNCGASTPDGCGGGVFSFNANPIIKNSIITDNVATRQTGPVNNTGYGGGIFLRNADEAVIQNNLIISNTASTAYCGHGGGLDLYGTANHAIIQDNQVFSNTATTTDDACSWGGGIAGGPDGAVIQRNIVIGNRVNSFGGGRGAGLYQWYGSATYLGNLVQGNIGGSAVYLGYSHSLFKSNVVVDNDTSYGVDLSYGDSGPSPHLVNNIIQITGSGRAVSLFSTSTFQITARLTHNTLVGSGAGSAVYLEGDYHAVYISNTIVTGFGTGLFPTLPDHYSDSVAYCLFWNNTSGGITGDHPVFGDPFFVNPAAWDFHLGPGSEALDGGAVTEITDDIDGESRSLGLAPDIGADEGWIRIYLPFVR